LKYLKLIYSEFWDFYQVTNMGAGSPMAIVVIAVNARVLLQFFPLCLPFALSFFTLSCFAPIRASPPVLGM
jgi:hypothetical protein